MATRIEFHLFDSFGRLDSVHPSMDSAIATKFKRYFGHRYTIRTVEVKVEKSK